MNKNNKAPFEGVKVKDKVYDIALGWGEVVKLENKGHVDFLARFVDSASNVNFAHYNSDGKKHIYASVFNKRTLYWNEPIIQETEREKELTVKGKVHVVESGRMCFTSNLLADLSSALKANEVKVQQDIEVTLTFKYKV